MSAFPKKKRYEGVQFNVISVTRGWVGVKFPGKKRYVTLEWPQSSLIDRTPSWNLKDYLRPLDLNYCQSRPSKVWSNKRK